MCSELRTIALLLSMAIIFDEKMLAGFVFIITAIDLMLHFMEGRK